ncbi:hypothetical protein BDP27DRAFT_1337144 [Rhodocollybia butyracea]|uniref:3-oxo-5-alpha-steroid 4-dehydrogenase C-terminal domain-containing protein n=1 Tax=Rhodocollybia butyracea TaxID=206335 RepID=A0A9P5TZZ0_9AGAR|nr:hypothetical protein BDP27DRAFT_1337144 [Rhodocollybia butyracea]
MLEAKILYDSCRKWFTLVSLITCPVLFVINAPFGRFAQTGKSIFILDGKKSWMVMEIVSPLMFTFCFVTSPLSPARGYKPSLAQYILAGAYLAHYANRAVISPLRTPSRSTSHVIVPISGVLFNILNGSLMGTYLSSPPASAYLSHSRPSFYIGLVLWVLGFAGNIIHDEILLNIRRKAKSKADGKISKNRNTADGKMDPAKSTSEHYAIPYGLLYKYVSYPNYFCEWIEWAGFALAASPIPFSVLPSSATVTNAEFIRTLSSPPAISAFIRAPSSSFAPSLTPPWIFLLNELVLMLPRAYKGHQWYKQRFGESYPKDRKVVVPFVL